MAFFFLSPVSGSAILPSRASRFYQRHHPNRRLDQVSARRHHLHPAFPAPLERFSDWLLSLPPTKPRVLFLSPREGLFGNGSQLLHFILPEKNNKASASFLCHRISMGQSVVMENKGQ